MLFSAGLRAIPEEVTEAAELDGARGMKRFLQVTWPMLWSIKRVAIVHLTITVMNVFVLVYIMTNGGPDRATEMLLTYLYQNAFTDSDYGYATAIAVANFGLVMILSVLILLAYRRNPEASRA
jgi:ABC-type sugar transport system permease subunit